MFESVKKSCKKVALKRKLLGNNIQKNINYLIN